MPLFSLLTLLFSDFLLFTTSIKNNVFPQPLTKEEEEKYIKQLLDGNQTARKLLIEHNLRLVAHIVKKYDNTKEDLEDLISIGTIGLIKGIDTFSDSHGTQLTTYCARCIENEILMHLRNLKKINKDVSLYEPIGYDKEGNEINLLDVLKVPDREFSDEVHLQDNIKHLQKYLCILTDREKEIIIYRYGLNNGPELTQKQIASRMKISRSYVSRIEKRALTKILRQFIKDEKTP